MSEKVDIKQYYLERKEKINSNIEKVLEMDKKFHFVTKNDYKYIYTMYKHFKDAEKEKMLFNLYNLSNKQEEPIIE